MREERQQRGRPRACTQAAREARGHPAPTCVVSQDVQQVLICLPINSHVHRGCRVRGQGRK